MDWRLQLAIVALSIVSLLAIRMPLGFVFGVVGSAGIFLYSGLGAWTVIAQQIHDMLSDFVLITIPLFVLIAELLSAAGFISDMYNCIEKLMGRIRGSLAVTTIIASALFSAVCGSSYVTAASLGRMTLPEMIGRHYDKRIAAGSVAAGGSLGILIPPSLAFVIYGYMSGASIAALFIAGIIPGALLSLLFIVAIVVEVSLSPARAGHGKRTTLSEKVRGSYKIFPIVLLGALMLASIYLGVTTPAEAAAIGTIISFSLCICYRILSLHMLGEALRRTIATSGFLLLLMSTAKILGFMMGKIGILYGLQATLAHLSQWQFLFIIYLTVVVLGLFLEGTSIIVLTTPIFSPAVAAAGMELVWYGVILVLFIEIALLTPPVGMNCYIVAQIGKPYGIEIKDVFRGSLPFLAGLAAAVVLVTLVPSLALWLPSTMK